MLKTGITPDFLTIDGMDGASSATSKAVSGFTGTPLDEALVFIHNALQGVGLRHKIKIIACGKIFTEQDMISKMSRYADICSSARAMMLAAGCNQQRECYKGICRQGIATQDKTLMEAFDLEERTANLINFHHTHCFWLYGAFICRRVIPSQSITAVPCPKKNKPC